MNMEYTTKIIKSNRRSLGFEIKERGVLIVRAPYGMSKVDIFDAIKRHESWIVKHMLSIEQKEEQRKNVKKISNEELHKMADKALEVIPPKVEYYAAILGVTYGRITIKNQKTIWGSCSSKGNLNFNCLLMLTPEQVMEYVVVHELCHRLEMNHSKRFWNLVEQVMPDYKIYKKWLKENGNHLIFAMTGCN